MPEITNANQDELNKKLKDEETVNSKSEINAENDNSAGEESNTDLKETLASKAVKEAREKVANEVKKILKRENSDKLELQEKDLEESKKKFNNDVKKEETVIQKIKNFISKIVLMQEEAKKEADVGKETNDSLENSSNSKVSDKKSADEIKSKYMLEYYDLPYRYNETVVKILAQTPKRLFVYWDISDNDRKKYETAFGSDFFNDTYPILLVHNEEKNYTFEVPINDFANSWYLDINDPKSKYVIQLGRKFKIKPDFINLISNQDSSIEILNDYIPITTSNILEVPNDHILFENIEHRALYRNIKTNEESYVDISNSDFINKMGKIYSVYDLYKEIYKNEIGDDTLTDLLNPSSMSSSGTNSSMFR